MTARKLTKTQYRILRNIRDHDGNTVAVGCYGLSQHGGFGRSCKFMELNGLITYERRAYHYALTDEGKRILEATENVTGEQIEEYCRNRWRRYPEWDAVLQQSYRRTARHSLIQKRLR